jgi:hypothetical protein
MLPESDDGETQKRASEIPLHPYSGMRPARNLYRIPEFRHPYPPKLPESDYSEDRKRASQHCLQPARNLNDIHEQKSRSREENSLSYRNPYIRRGLGAEEKASGGAKNVLTGATNGECHWLAPVLAVSGIFLHR